MAIFLSPGVFAREIDLSLYAQNLSTTALGLVGLAAKGPINDPQYITTPAQFSLVFGDPPNPDTEFFPGVYAALQFLRTGKQLYYVRVSELDPDDTDGSITGTKYLAKPAATDLTEQATAPKLTGTVNTLVTFTSSNNVMTFIVDGAGPGFSVTFSLGSASSVQKSMKEIAALLNANSVFATYLVASTTATGCLSISGLSEGVDHCFQISGTAITANHFGFSGSGSLTDLAFGTGTPTERAYILGSSLPSSVTIVASTNDSLNIWAGTTKAAAAAVSFVIPAATYTPTQLVDALNAISGFSTNYVASLFTGVSGVGQVKMAVKSGSTITHLALSVGADDAGPFVFGKIEGQKLIVSNATFPLTITTSNNALNFTLEEYTTPGTLAVAVTVPSATYSTVGDLVTALNGVTAFSGNLTADVVTVSGTDYLTVEISSAYDNLMLDSVGTGHATIFGKIAKQHKDTTTTATTLSAEAATAGTWGNKLSLEITNNGSSFDLSVYENGVRKETYKSLVLTPSTVADSINPSVQIPNPVYFENAVNGVSSRITLTNATDNLLLPKTTLPTARIQLSGGTNGETPSSISNPAVFIGYATADETTGLQLFRNPEELDINLLAVPGVSSPAVINEMIDLCQSRADCMCLVDSPSGYSPQKVVNWANGVVSADYDDHQAFNSSYAALYWPWQQIYDPVNGKTVWTPPSGHVAQAYAYTDLNFDPWSAPAGLVRGHLVSPLKAQYRPTAGDRDLLYLNNVNPIVTFIRDGINIYGQKTLQRTSTALDRINVRRLMLYISKVVVTASRRIVFEPDEPSTWVTLTNLIEPFLDSIKNRRGITEFKVVCDSTTNTADVIERNEMVCNVFIKPTKTAEFISLNFIITSQTAQLDSLIF